MRSNVQKTTFSPTRPPLSRVLLASLWLASVTSMAVSLLPKFGSARVVAALASLLFIAVLIGKLIRTSPHAADLPDLAPLIAPRLGFWGLTVALTLGILLLLGVGLIISPGASLLAATCLIALAMAITWRSQVSRRVVLLGLAAGLIVGLGIRLLEYGQLSWAFLNAIVVPPVFVAGALLLQRSKLSQVRLLAGQCRRGLHGFAWGCVLAAPAAILNLLGNVQAGDTWVVHWWQPLAALDPAIAEEIWARLFLTTLVYAMLRPVSNSRPGGALCVAVLLSSLAHAFAHSGINPIGLLIGGILYGAPTGLLFVKRDLEHAIGYHFFIDGLRYLAALIAVAAVPG